MNPLVNYVFQQFFVFYAASKGYAIDIGCGDHVVMGLSAQLGTYNQFATDELHPWQDFIESNNAFIAIEKNCHTYIDGMIKEAAARSYKKVLHE